MFDNEEELIGAFRRLVVESVNKENPSIFVEEMEEVIDNFDLSELRDFVRNKAEEQGLDTLLDLVNLKSEDDFKEWIIDFDYCLKHKVQYAVCMLIFAYLLAGGCLLTDMLVKNITNSKGVKEIASTVEKTEDGKKLEVAKSEAKDLSKKIASDIRNGVYAKALRNWKK